MLIEIFSYFSDVGTLSKCGITALEVYLEVSKVRCVEVTSQIYIFLVLYAVHMRAYLVFFYFIIMEKIHGHVARVKRYFF